MTGEFTPKSTSAEAAPEIKEPSLQALQLAGALQAVIANIPRRNFDLDLDQEDGLYAIGNGLLDGETAGYIESATGSGKSLYIALLAEAATNAGLRTHILTASTRNANQLAGNSGDKGLARFGTLVDRGLVKENYGGRRASRKHPVVVSTYAGFLEESKARESGKPGRLGEFDLILGDESHKSLGDETSRALYRYMPDAVKVGFSATPDYAEDRKSEEIWGRRWHEFSYRDSIEAGKAAPMRAMVLATGTELTLEDYRRDFTEKELEPLIDNFERNGLAAQLAQDFVRDGRQGIIACVPGRGNAHATAMADLLSQQEIEPGGRKMVVRDIGSHLEKDVYDQRIRDYEAGKIDILTFTKALEDSWDSRKPSFCINLSPTTSPVRIKQLMGRIGRPNEKEHEDDPEIESIFVDFVDENMGTTHKMQYTAVHALEYEDIDIDRVLGWGGYTHSEPKVKPRRRSIVSYIRPELIDRLMRVQGKSLTDVLAGRGKRGTEVDPLFMHYERILAKEGMPAEVPYNMALTPALDAKYQKAAKILRVIEGDEPTVQEVIASLDGITQEQRRVLAVYGERILEASGEIFETEARESTEDIVARLMLKHIVTVTMETLSQREAGVIRMRLLSEEPRTLAEIGQVYGVNPERIRQILTHALSKLRHPSRANYFNDYYGANYPLPGEKLDRELGRHRQFKLPKHETPFSEFSNIPTNDPKDGRPYFERLSQHVAYTTERWLIDRRIEMDDIMGYGPDTQQKLAVTARKFKPTGYTIKGRFYKPDEVPPKANLEKAGKTYNLNALRLAELSTQYFAANTRLAAYHKTRNGLDGKIGTTSASRASAEMVLESKINVQQQWVEMLRSQMQGVTEQLDSGEQITIT